MSPAIKALAIAVVMFTLPVSTPRSYNPPNLGGPTSTQGTGTRLYFWFQSSL